MAFCIFKLSKRFDALGFYVGNDTLLRFGKFASLAETIRQNQSIGQHFLAKPKRVMPPHKKDT